MKTSKLQGNHQIPHLLTVISSRQEEDEVSELIFLQHSSEMREASESTVPQPTIKTMTPESQKIFSEVESE